MGLIAVAIIYPAIQLATVKRAEIPPGLLQSLAQKLHHNELKLPLQGKIAIVTGSTSGVGKGAASELLKVSVCVIIFLSSYDIYCS